jgi:hypothetical protein
MEKMQKELHYHPGLAYSVISIGGIPSLGSNWWARPGSEGQNICYGLLVVQGSSREVCRDVEIDSHCPYRMFVLSVLIELEEPSLVHRAGIFCKPFCKYKSPATIF